MRVYTGSSWIVFTGSGVTGITTAATGTAIDLDANQNVRLGVGSLATTATDGFPYIPTCAGTPTGTPTTKTGFTPLVFDTTNDLLYAWDGSAWSVVTGTPSGATYEEGSFTPTISDLTNDATVYGIRQGRYEKIGRTVHFHCHIQVTNQGSMVAGANAYITGLPYTSYNFSTSFDHPVVVSGSSFNITAGQVVAGIVENNTSRVKLQLWDAAGGVSNLLCSELSLPIFSVYGSYQVTATA